MIILTKEHVKPATAKISFTDLIRIGQSPGNWIEIHTEGGKTHYCRLWPAKIPDNHIIVDPFITKDADIEQATTIIPINKPSIAVKVSLRITINNLNDEEQLAQFGFIFNKATERQRLAYLKRMLNGLVVRAGCRLSKLSSSPIIINVEYTYPKDTHVMISNATCISLTDKENGPVTELEHSFQQMSITTDTKQFSNSSSLQKAYDALFEVVCYPLLYKDWFEKLNIECPKGILLYGPPGVGKTFLVSSMAKRCNAKMFIIQGPEMYGPYIGESEEKLRAKFIEAQDYAMKKSLPVILFIDEIDALTPKRDDSQSHENRMVAQLLTLMDGVKSRGRLVIVGATNRPNSIDPALRRPGRFDREISMEPPSVDDRYSLFESQVGNIPLDKSVDIQTLANMTNGYVAADINAVCREAALLAVQRASKNLQEEVLVTMSDFVAAFAAVGPSMQRGFQVQVEKMNWSDVGGLKEVKKRLKQAVEWPLLYKESFAKLGLKAPRGILLYGPPGCSKTSLVKILAASTNIAFLSINGAQLYSAFVGDSEKVVRTTFQKARSSAPAIIFLDETEAIVGKRNMGSGGSGGDSVQERVLSTLLNEMDGIESADSVLVIGATNRPDMLDAALMRPGRFDQIIYVPPPDEEARLEILKIHTRNMPLSPDVDLINIAKRTEYYTGADLQNVCREAAMEALRAQTDTPYVTMSHFNSSLSIIPPSLNEHSNYKRINES
ncbi:P-loop containing nucleoside triphosphate hydrolase protein [Rhizopus microsporus]